MKRHKRIWKTKGNIESKWKWQSMPALTVCATGLKLPSKLDWKLLYGNLGQYGACQRIKLFLCHFSSSAAVVFRIIRQYTIRFTAYELR